MPIAEDKVYAALREVHDPELYVNIVDLGLIYGIGVDELGDGRSKLHVIMTMTTPACPFGPELIEQAKDALMDLDEVAEAEVTITLNPPWTPDRMSEEARDELGMF